MDDMTLSGVTRRTAHMLSKRLGPPQESDYNHQDSRSEGKVARIVKCRNGQACTSDGPQVPSAVQVCQTVVPPVLAADKRISEARLRIGFQRSQQKLALATSSLTTDLDRCYE